jgi:hypothetical protein
MLAMTKRFETEAFMSLSFNDKLKEKGVTYKRLLLSALAYGLVIGFFAGYIGPPPRR